jgi:hypothetical protein
MNSLNTVESHCATLAVTQASLLRQLSGDNPGRHHPWLGGSGTHGPSRSKAGIHRLPPQQILPAITVQI